MTSNILFLCNLIHLVHKKREKLVSDHLLSMTGSKSSYKVIMLSKKFSRGKISLYKI